MEGLWDLLLPALAFRAFSGTGPSFEGLWRHGPKRDRYKAWVAAKELRLS